MFAAHENNNASPLGRSPAIPVCCAPGTAANPSNLLTPPAWLRRDDLKLAVRLAYGYGAGGEKIDVIAIDLGVSRGKAAKMLSPNYPDAIGARHLERIAARNPAVASKLGIAGAEARAA